MSADYLIETEVEHTPRDRADVAVADESGDALEALSSETARAVVNTLADDPKPLCEIAEVVGTTLQNTDYHVEQLVDAGFVESIGVWYSQKGREMSVYGLTAEEVVVQFGADSV